ncbi:17556_t:CDS:1, partial [Gigaspora rosea]
MLDDDNDTQKNLLNKLKNEYQNDSGDKKSLESSQETLSKRTKRREMN